MSHDPYFVNTYIEKYFEPIVTLVSRNIVDNIPEEPGRIYCGWDYKVDEYKVQNEYVLDGSSNKYTITVDINECHMKNKYAPPSGAGYYITTCVFEYNKDTRNKTIESYINHLLGNLEIELQEQSRADAGKYLC